jgi:hypothetical protein
MAGHSRLDADTPSSGRDSTSLPVFDGGEATCYPSGIGSERSHDFYLHAFIAL